MNASTERQQKPPKANRRTCSARSSSSSKKRKSTSAGINNSNAPKRTARNRHIKTPNAGGVVESKTANSTTHSSTDGSTDSVSTDNDADDVRSSWPPRRIAVIPTPLPRPPNNASIDDYLTTFYGTPLFKNLISKPADNIDGASTTENGFRKAIQEFRDLNQRKLDSHRRGTTIDTAKDLLTIRSNIVKFAGDNNQVANLGGMPTKETRSAQLLQPADGKTQRTLNKELKKLEAYAEERKFPSVNAAVRRICHDLRITEDELYGYA
eukprot:scaffold33843_cov66-Cyclotella_meneghiniana.AAC.6